MRLIGITGGVGAGKSEILSYIREHYKCRIYLADEVAHLVERKGERCYFRLVELMGEEILETSGEIDKKKMAARIFADEDLLAQVNGIVHPEVRLFLENKVQEARQSKEVELFFVEAALLIEAGYQEMVDELWYVYADEEVRKERLRKNRGYSMEKIEQIMSSQLTEAEFRKKCDFVIDNSGKPEDSFLQVRKRLQTYVKTTE